MKKKLKLFISTGLCLLAGKGLALNSLHICYNVKYLSLAAENDFKMRTKDGAHLGSTDSS